jgi:hypothetical protein
MAGIAGVLGGGFANYISLILDEAIYRLQLIYRAAATDGAYARPFGPTG